MGARSRGCGVVASASTEPVARGRVSARTELASVADVLRGVAITPLAELVAHGKLPTARERLAAIVTLAFAESALCVLGDPGDDVVLERLRRFVLTGRGLDA